MIFKHELQAGDTGSPAGSEDLMEIRYENGNITRYITNDGQEAFRSDNHEFVLALVNGDNSALESATRLFPDETLKGFNQAVKQMRTFFFWVLDMDAEPFNGYGLATRLAAYRDTFGMPDKDMGFSIAEAHTVGDGEDLTTVTGIEGAAKMRDALLAKLEQTKRRIKDSTPSYHAETIESFAIIEIAGLVREETQVRRCQYCGKYFISHRGNVRYCKECNAAGGRSKNYERNIKSDSIQGTYRRSYKTMYARLMKGNISDGEMKAWKTEAKKKRALAQEGKLSAYEFREALENLMGW